MPYRVAGAKNLAHRYAVGAVSAQYVDHACGNACTHRQFCGSQGGQRGEFSRFDHHWATGGQGGCDFARDHGQGEIPRGDGCANTNRLVDHHQPAVVVELRQRFTVDPFGFFCVPLDKARAISDFTFGFGIGFALFGSQDTSQIIHMGHEQVEPASQQLTAFFGGFLAPSWPCRIGGGHGLFCFLGAQVGDLRQQVAGAGVVDIETARACDPLPIDQCISFEKAGIFQQ